jgi:hypothetical protein
MTSRDDRHRRAAARLHDIAVGLAAEVVARGGSLAEWYDLTDTERAEAQEKARTFWPERMRAIRVEMTNNVARSRRMGRPPSTDSS